MSRSRDQADRFEALLRRTARPALPLRTEAWPGPGQVFPPGDLPVDPEISGLGLDLPLRTEASPAWDGPSEGWRSPVDRKFSGLGLRTEARPARSPRAGLPRPPVDRKISTGPRPALRQAHRCGEARRVEIRVVGVAWQHVALAILAFATGLTVALWSDPAVRRFVLESCGL